MIWGRFWLPAQYFRYFGDIAECLNHFPIPSSFSKELQGFGQGGGVELENHNYFQKKCFLKTQ